MRAEVVATGVPFGEGPVWDEADDTLVCASVSHGALYRVSPRTGVSERFAVTGGGANAAAPAADGSYLVTQNGGIDLVALGHLRPGDAPPVAWRTPGIQRVARDGAVASVSRAAMQAPNDLAVHAGGTLYFTDPGPFPGTEQVARVMALEPDGQDRVVSSGFAYTNGIAVDLDGTSLLVVADHRTLIRLHDGESGHEVVVADLGAAGGDGLCLDEDGTIYVATRTGNAVCAFDRAGALVEVLDAGGETGMVTNCCFGGPDRRVLFATEARGNRVVAWDAMPVAGLPLTPWPG